MAFIFSPVISVIKELSAKSDEMVTLNNLERTKFLQIHAQLLTIISRKAANPLLMNARGMVINMMQMKKFSFECVFDHVYTLKFSLMIDNASADSFTFDLEKISHDDKIESAEDKAVIAFARKYLLKYSFFTNGDDNIKISIVDHIAANASSILMRNLPHLEIIGHNDLDVICYSSILNVMKPFYDKEQAATGQAEPTANEEEKEQSNIFSINPEKESE